jgi:hypothetical protein
MVPSVAATAAIGVALAQGALAASFSVSGQSFKVSADKLDGRGFTQYGTVDTGKDLQGNAEANPVAVSGFTSATINNLCQSVVTPDVPLLGSISLDLTAGTGATPVTAKNLYIDTTDLDSTNATFTNINIGVAAGSTTGAKVSPGDQGKVNPNEFAQEADRAVLTGVKQTAWATTAGTFKLSGLSMHLHKGVKECY